VRQALLEAVKQAGQLAQVAVGQVSLAQLVEEE
jgi:hypothetical protein